MIYLQHSVEEDAPATKEMASPAVGLSSFSAAEIMVDAASTAK